MQHHLKKNDWLRKNFWSILRYRLRTLSNQLYLQVPFQYVMHYNQIARKKGFVYHVLKPFKARQYMPDFEHLFGICEYFGYQCTSSIISAILCLFTLHCSLRTVPMHIGCFRSAHKLYQWSTRAAILASLGPI